MSQIHVLRPRVVAAESVEDDADFVDLRKRAGLDLERQLLANAEVERREPDGRSQLAPVAVGVVGVGGAVRRAQLDLAG